MEKLKTLKDLKEEYQTDAETYSMDEFESKVKQEAIKWVKEDMEISEQFKVHPQERLKVIMLKWRERLNITEDDLK